MTGGRQASFGAQLKALRGAAGFTQEELATIAGLSVHAVSALERGERRRPHVETVRALSAALDLNGTARDAFLVSARAAAPAPAAEHGRGVSLPVALTGFVGRETDLQTLRRWLDDPTARLITLTGPGGVGKTRLALELARTNSTDGTTRALFVGLAAVRNSTLVAPAIAQALGVPDGTPHDLPRLARRACDATPTLLVLDNFEQVSDAAPLVADLLTSVAVLRVVVTSRAALRVRGEREYVVGPLALDANVDSTSPADVARSPAVRLFVERVRDVQPGFRVTAANGPVVTAICRRLDALPLALELAAPWIKALTAEDLLRRLMSDALLSPLGARDLPERQQTINATVAWSYQLLPPNEQRVFRRLGALPGRFSIEAAVAVMAGAKDSVAIDDVIRHTAGLIDKSLLLRAETSVGTRPLYRMLETVRAFAALELTAAGERDDTMAGLVKHCVEEASLARRGLVGTAQADWLDRVDDGLETYRSGLAWLVERGRADEAAGVACELMFFWLIRGHGTEGLRWYQEALELPSLSKAAETRVLLGMAHVWYTQGELGRARDVLIRALELAHDAVGREMIAQAEHLFGHIEHALGNDPAARERFTRSLSAFRSLAIPWGAASALSGLAWVALASGDVDEAERLLDEAAPVLRGAGPWFQLLPLYLRAILAIRRGNPDEAIALVRRSLGYIRDLHDRFAFMYALVPLEAAAALKSSDAWAARILGIRHAVTERTGARFVDRSVDDLREEAERKVRARLDRGRWERAYAAGRVTSIDWLIKEIDNVMSRHAHA